ncbi:hypothetical protein H0I31_06085 [Tenacibaculum sp. AHE15PA]|uniref:hypothetical protein n=1 Tax=unclassified Tenacibaculum TaxID=2635139 RepID=UPI001C4ED9CE|nr:MULTISPECIES: hypothetical protein [unclassified Tenacibaculum]QXP73264.1 hypothetical protein H0I30_11345 [Tenacibaculum sp. AHE14PA]QXP77177.1 hypothetical protein H0I31_06085 [Tenacibaculum sp. AHE15PA]
MIINSQIKNNGFIAFLLLLVIAIGLLSYQNASEYSELKKVFKLEKIELESELNSVIKNYENAIYQKEDISLNLRDKLHKIIKLRDTINNLKTTDYGLFRLYRKRISGLAKQNKILFAHIDSLNAVNNQLLTKNDSVKDILIQKEGLYTRLKNKNQSLDLEKKVLKEKIAIAEIIETSSIKVVAMKKRRSGKHTSTSYSSKTDAFKIEFNLLENNIISSGEKSIYIQIVNNDKVIAPTQEVKLKNKEKILCNDKFKAKYNNKQLAVISFIDVDRDMINKGSYKINVFIDGVFTNSTLIELK